MISIIDFGSSKTRLIANAIDQIGFRPDIIHWNESKKIDRRNTSAYILSGAPVLITQTDISAHLLHYEFLKKVTVPILGICFGHQLLGMLHGAQVFKGEEIRTETEISIILNNILFEGLNGKIKMVEDHTEGITLPHSFITLASSEKYEVESMRHSVKNIFGVQFHPEASGENGLKLLSNFCKMI